MVKGKRVLSAQEEQSLAEVLKRYVYVSHAGVPKCLLTLELTEKNEEIVTKQVMKRHKELLVHICSALPRPPPSPSSMTKSFMKALDEHSSLQQVKLHWARDETQKLHMVWRYVIESLRRSPTSRDHALYACKMCFSKDFQCPDTAEDSQCPDTALDQSCSESDEAIGRALVESQCSDAAGGADEVPIEAAEEAGARRGGAMGSPLEAEGLRDGPAPSGSMQAVLLQSRRRLNEDVSRGKRLV